jgi:catechol 2,3-dioxygenase-like lactoylglutathione lyase family enzyme
MIDHLGFTVSDIARSKAFYDAAFAPLGVTPMMTVEAHGFPIYGYGRTKPDFWISADQLPMRSLHVALTAESRAQVDAFHAAALAAGGRDNGPPGIRAQYHPNYYGAFVFDPDGNNIEAVCHRPG